MGRERAAARLVEATLRDDLRWPGGEAGRERLEACLCRPLQRAMRLPLLFRDVARHAAGHAARPEVARAVEGLEALSARAARALSESRQCGEVSGLLRLYESLENPPEDLITPRRCSSASCRRAAGDEGGQQPNRSFDLVLLRDACCWRAAGEGGADGDASTRRLRYSFDLAEVERAGSDPRAVGPGGRRRDHAGALSGDVPEPGRRDGDNAVDQYHSVSRTVAPRGRTWSSPAVLQRLADAARLQARQRGREELRREQQRRATVCPATTGRGTPPTQLRRRSRSEDAPRLGARAEDVPLGPRGLPSGGRKKRARVGPRETPRASGSMLLSPRGRRGSPAAAAASSPRARCTAPPPPRAGGGGGRTPRCGRARTGRGGPRGDQRARWRAGTGRRDPSPRAHDVGPRRTARPWRRPRCRAAGRPPPPRRGPAERRETGTFAVTKNARHRHHVYKEIFQRAHLPGGSGADEHGLPTRDAPALLGDEIVDLLQQRFDRELSRRLISSLARCAKGQCRWSAEFSKVFDRMAPFFRMWHLQQQLPAGGLRAPAAEAGGQAERVLDSIRDAHGIDCSTRISSPPSSASAGTR